MCSQTFYSIKLHIDTLYNYQAIFTDFIFGHRLSYQSISALFISFPPFVHPFYCPPFCPFVCLIMIFFTAFVPADPCWFRLLPSCTHTSSIIQASSFQSAAGWRGKGGGGVWRCERDFKTTTFVYFVVMLLIFFSFSFTLSVPLSNDERRRSKKNNFPPESRINTHHCGFIHLSSAGMQGKHPTSKQMMPKVTSISTREHNTFLFVWNAHTHKNQPHHSLIVVNSSKPHAASWFTHNSRIPSFRSDRVIYR